ncbi:MAG TPA: hypothetical protein VLB76_15780 [Thermoanaerobaculia bacterium]|jgi:hypothetical protein|nr:hypothetical protein [Thermoanaerobaculia bacterium]
MKKRMERLGDKLFQPLAEAEQSRITGGLVKDPPQTYTAITIFETYDPAPDFVHDGDNE